MEPTPVKLVDSLGNAIVKPDAFTGTVEEFAALVHDLKPFHCSFPNGQILDEKTGRPCRHEKTKEGVCKKHSVEMLPYVINDAPVTLRDAIIKSWQDPKLDSTRTHLAIGDAILARRLQAAEAGESERAMKLLTALNTKVLAAFAQFQSAQRSGDTADMADALNTAREASGSIAKVLTKRKSAMDALDNLEATNGRLLQAKEIAARTAAAQRMTLSYEAVVLTIRELCEAFHDAISTTVRDQGERVRALEEMSRRTYAIAGRTREHVSRN